MMLRLTQSGRLRGLTHLTCFQWPVSLETMLFLIDQCPELSVIFGLDMLMLCPKSIALIQVGIHWTRAIFEGYSSILAVSDPYQAE